VNLDKLSESLIQGNEALSIVNELIHEQGAEVDQHIAWLQSQLTNIINEMAAMQIDIESGLSIQHLGFSNQDEFEEMLDGFAIEIASLKSQIRSILIERKGRVK
jgi:hypothetical protein